MKVDFDNKLISIFGLHETGKTHFAKTIASQYHTAVYDVLGEYDPEKYDVWRPDHDQYPEVQEEFDRFLKYIREQKVEGNAQWEMLVCDEASTVLPNKKSLDSNINNFLNYYRHSLDEKGWDMGGMFIARRPARVNTNIVELSRYIIIFRVTGKNDIKYLNQIADGLGDDASKLGSGDRPDHEYILVHPDRKYQIMEPL